MAMEVQEPNTKGQGLPKMLQKTPWTAQKVNRKRRQVSIIKQAEGRLQPTPFTQYLGLVLPFAFARLSSKHFGYQCKTTSWAMDWKKPYHRRINVYSFWSQNWVRTPNVAFNSLFRDPWTSKQVEWADKPVNGKTRAKCLSTRLIAGTLQHI